MKYAEMPYQEVMLNTKVLEVPRTSYQRELNPARVRKIAVEFDERIANEPKVSFRNGHYYVFDGQHTIAARKLRNKGKDLPVMCKVFRGLTEADEAILFAQQTGASAKLTAGAKLRALVYGGDPDAMAFLKATEGTGIRIDFSQSKGKYRLACISTAYGEFQKVGVVIYKEALQIIADAWGGDPDSLRAETVQGVVRFVDLYHEEYDPKRLVSRFRRTDPLLIYREGKAAGSNMPGYKKYLYQVYRIYNGSSQKNALPLRF